MKVRTCWCCDECGHTQARWTGQCPSCGKWNTLHEDVPVKEELPNTISQRAPVRLSEIASTPLLRHSTGFHELDRSLGGGIVPGGLLLLGGEPGIGKSTLSLQVAHQVGKSNVRVLYVSGEESLEQVALRAKRLNVSEETVLFYNDTQLEKIAKVLEESRPHLVIIDSVQVVFRSDIPSSPGSVAQVRECTASLMRVAKSLHTAMIIIGHVTKSGEIAGPKVLEHLVDTVLYFEGEQQQNLRIVRTMKNRFGPTDEVAVFNMGSHGLSEVKNPSLLFVQDRAVGTAGSVIMPMVEGTRPMLIEAQALVTRTFFQTPSRKSTGMDPNRLALLLAVCEKRARLQLYQNDVFVSITGGVRITEPAADLGVLLAIVSSYANKVFDPHTAVVGEVGLGGEVRSVPRIEMRVKEAIQMGFTTCIVPQKNMTALSSFKKDVKIIPVSWVDEAIDRCL